MTTPKPITGEFIRKVDSYDYFVSTLIPYQSVTLVIRLLDSSSSNEVYRYFVEVKGEEYTKWGEDDSYLDTIVENSVKSVVPGLTLQFIPPSST